MNKAIVVLVLMSVQISCKSQTRDVNLEKAYTCILNEVGRNKVEPVGADFRKQLSDTLSWWINNVNNTYMRRYKKIRYEISDYMLFNKDYSKGIGFVIKYRNPGEKLDFVDIITGEKKGGNWNFYYVGVPSMSFDQYGDSVQRQKPISKDSIERRVLETMIKDGYYKKECVRDYRYFEKQWFPDWIRKKHKAEFYIADQ